ncbi:hypothetical protein TIFTF001_049558 [Ficus carica]|uniref:Uncharacterized protein n=1 Tax=Ficus carica TaxID=3494 RepID=A0AA87ZUR2_FICCA|nr:hypothetical protein TIFTF001_049549 [Ficus carica]GMN29621.1 hypothetical protein TIFTF001_049550 [Ficus carica]GMN29661.1 hypothetical protein TIFTF001_049557 [Ficus carica]GMN29684.1 hypothetical protein TIFTF001_049558 [Ficus carica]
MATGDRRIDHWASQKGKIKAGPCRANPWFADGITSFGELALYFYLDLSLLISLSPAKPGIFVHLRLAERKRVLPTVVLQDATMDGLGKEKMFVRREQQKLKMGKGKKKPATSWNLVKVRFVHALHRQPEEIFSSLNQWLNRGKGIEARGQAGATVYKLN